jgi:hypothetical protein
MKSLSVIKAKFRRSPPESKLFQLWDDESDSNKQIIREALPAIKNESVILCYFESKNYWWIITNDQLIVNGSNEILYVPVDQIKSVEMNDLMDGNNEDKIDATIYIHTPKKIIRLPTKEKVWMTAFELLVFITN